MPKYRLMTPEEQGIQAAELIGSFHAELVKKGIDKELAASIAAKVVGAASSFLDGHCGDLARAGEEVMNPVQ